MPTVWMLLYWPPIRSLVERRRAIAAMEKPTKAWMEEVEGYERAARTRVRRVLAALNGVDVENATSPWTEPPAILSREIVAELCEAPRRHTVFAAVEKRLGSDRVSGSSWAL